MVGNQVKVLLCSADVGMAHQLSDDIKGGAVEGMPATIGMPQRVERDPICDRLGPLVEPELVHSSNKLFGDPVHGEGATEVSVHLRPSNRVDYRLGDLRYLDMPGNVLPFVFGLDSDQGIVVEKISPGKSAYFRLTQPCEETDCHCLVNLEVHGVSGPIGLSFQEGQDLMSLSL